MHTELSLEQPHLWPETFLAQLGLNAQDANASVPSFMDDLDLPHAVGAHLWRVYQPLIEWFDQTGGVRNGTPMVLGLSGAQGTGKSTAAEILTRALKRRGWHVCQLSLDDLYLSRHQRQTLAQVVHPLLATRGVPGTHDVSLGLTLLEQLRTAGPVTTTYLPRFDKAADEPKAHDQWSVVRGRPELIILDGWCLGARPQPAEALLAPCNALEAQEDTDGLWRRYVNARLHDYQTLFAQVDILVMLKAPSFTQIYKWRALQEQKLRARLSELELVRSKIMSPKELVRFISHYERLTRWILKDLPSRADILLALNSAHEIDRVEVSPRLVISN